MDLRALVSAQAGVVARRQLHDAGLRDHDIARLVRRRVLARVHPGVYVDHTGPLTHDQRRWAAVLVCWPSALSHTSAFGAGDDDPVHVAVDRDRRVRPPSGVVVHRVTDLDRRVRWHVGPPRLRIEDAALLAASSARDDLGAIAVLTEVCGCRLTTPARLLGRLDELRGLPRRRWLRSVLIDVHSGTNSVLEHGYLTRVERPHGLPRGQRQARSTDGSRTAWRDVRYAREDVVVELDGRLHHDSPAQRAHDLDRDLASAAHRREVTVRLGWAQVFSTPCRTADLMGRVLQHAGWGGRVQACPGCGTSRSAHERDVPQPTVGAQLQPEVLPQPSQT